MTDKLLEEIVVDLDRHDRSEIWPPTDIDRLAPELATALGTPVERAPAEEYVHGDGLIVRFAAALPPPSGTGKAASGVPEYLLYIRFSWVVPYVWLDWKRREGATVTYVIDDALPSSLREISDAIRHLLTKHGQKVLSGPILDALVPDRTSYLDDSALSVREALFSALD